jgi:hypothetical protein
MSPHIHRTPMRETARYDEGVRWCFRCRRRVRFWMIVMETVEPSYYGPSATIRCEHGHHDGDCFPGTYREGGDE